MSGLKKGNGEISKIREKSNFQDTIEIIGYMTLYLSKMEKEIREIQEGTNTNQNQSGYYIGKLNYALERIDEIGFKSFKENIKGLTIEDLLESEYMNIA